LRGPFVIYQIQLDDKVSQVLIEQWHREYNQVHPHSAGNYHQPAPEAIFDLRIMIELKAPAILRVIKLHEPAGKQKPRYG
jgi:hypothetical protein